MIEQLLTAQNNHNTLVDFSLNAERRIEVHQFKNKRWIYTGGQSIQSTLLLDNPAQLQQQYQQVMLVALLLNPKPKTILNLGFGGGAFERFFAAHAKQTHIVPVDIDEPLVSLAKKYLEVPKQWPVIIDSAQNYLAQSQETFELILCDLFNGQEHALCVEQPLFYQQAKKRLTNNGIISVNLSPTDQSAVIELLKMLREIFTGVMISKVKGFGNIVVILSQQPLPATLATTENTTHWPLDFAQLSEGFWLLPE